jgi:hypothetical protein
MKSIKNAGNPEHGGAGAKLLVVLVLLILLGNAGYKYIPVAYNGQSTQQEMQAIVTQAMLVPPSTGTPVDVAKKKLTALAMGNGAPPDTLIEVKMQNNVLRARVAYVKSVPVLPFGIWDYRYEFDHTVTPTGFLASGN